MQPGTERRDPHAPRFPLDVLVQLAHEDFHEPFDADSVDVSRGGIALRSDYLPEVGDRLRCRFECPPQGAPIEAFGEVVWAHDAGERSGHFGLRFQELDDRAEASLQQLLGMLHQSAPQPIDVALDGPIARLHLDGVASAIDASVVWSDEEELIVEQELPFLRIGMGVSVEYPGSPGRGELASVELRLEQGVPRLVIGVRHPPAPDATLHDYEPGFDAGAELTPPEAQAVLVGHAPEEAIDEPSPDSPIVFSIDSRDAITPGDLAAAEVERWWLDRSLARAKERGAVWWAELLPALTRGAIAFAAFGSAAAAKAGPWAQRAWGWMQSAGLRAFSAIAARMPRRAKRRTAAAPARVAQQPGRKRRQQQKTETVRAPRTLRRIAVLGVIGSLAIAATVYALVPRAEPERARLPAPPVLPPPVIVVAAPPAPVVAVPPPPAAEPEPLQELGDLEPPADPRALPEPADEAGRLHEPTFRTLRSARAPAAPVVSEGTSFGDATVPHGHTARIRMSHPVTVLRGEQQPDGFTVTIPDALALDRAGPLLASTSSAIDRASIINRGDHSVLTVHFVADRTPAYRVVARGPAIEITIGR